MIKEKCDLVCVGKEKETYIAPVLEVIHLEVENNVMVGSINTGSGYEPGYWSGANCSSTGNHNYNAASTGDLDELINDILTVEQ